MDEAPWKKTLLWLLAAGCLFPGVTPPLALFAGMVFALLVGRADEKLIGLVQKQALQASVVGLGFGIQFSAVLKAGSAGAVATAGSLLATIGLGLVLARWLRVERTTGYLISTGTAVCGGSAIAAMGPVLGAQPREMSVALGCVFVLNAVALFVFPLIGHGLSMPADQFGYWAAIAIHDTSSVVGAAARYSPDSLAIAVPVKLARALWILPVAGIAAALCRKPGSRVAFPWFILLFIGASATASFVPAGAAFYPWLSRAARAGLGAALFLIGASLSPAMLKSVGWRPFAHGILLWLVVSAVSLWAVLQWG